MSNIKFILGLGEWHLVDEDDNVLLNIPVDFIDDCETKDDVDFTVKEISWQALRAAEEGEDLYGCDINKYVDEVDDDDVTQLMVDTLSEYYGLTA